VSRDRYSVSPALAEAKHPIATERGDKREVNRLPAGDRSGPMGMGPRTGRGGWATAVATMRPAGQTQHQAADSMAEADWASGVVQAARAATVLAGAVAAGGGDTGITRLGCHVGGLRHPGCMMLPMRPLPASRKSTCSKARRSGSANSPTQSTSEWTSWPRSSREAGDGAVAVLSKSDGALHVPALPTHRGADGRSQKGKHRESTMIADGRYRR
jgi:hypothetical protein